MVTKHIMKQSDKIYVAGHRGLVGSAIVRKLKSEGFNNILVKTHEELDLTNQQAVNTFFESERPDYVFMAFCKSSVIVCQISSVAARLLSHAVCALSRSLIKSASSVLGKDVVLHL